MGLLGCQAVRQQMRGFVCLNRPACWFLGSDSVEALNCPGVMSRLGANLAYVQVPSDHCSENLAQSQAFLRQRDYMAADVGALNKTGVGRSVQNY